ncbi:fumarylacetoacetate hydrolase family protein [Kitasatospora sp. NA04385]|uniref:fumarylacetoacetate hydrolase family protein n=1 Tax=Kitasatospora sp. NA04385 TaxID=2742135 RepID=UPI00158FADB9|nr:fumarylacetoacetate hydrolase family protein [Kitasatospora sp. NA04385]QKW17771.1 fumarylacetoacetate hydrolase family protein [Kitasatospora sp. NA04385]
MRFVRARLDGRTAAFLLTGADGAGPAAEAVELAAPAGPDPLLALLAGPGPAGLRSAAERALRDGARVAAADLEVLAPLHRPGKIIAIGLNYHDHTAETGLEPPKVPLTFAKHSTSVTGPGAPITVPAGLTEQVDWEAELAVVIGTACGPARRGTAADVFAYTVANDVSARDLQFSDQQWTRGKSLDTFCPLGPELVTTDEIDDPYALRIWTEVNGETMQDASTGDMIFKIDELLDFVTAGTTLEPGDVILTGTPPGVGGFRTPPVYLRDGDTVTVGVEGIGTLANPVVRTQP